MTKELLDTIKKAGVIVTIATMGGVGGYFISDEQPPEIEIVEKIVLVPQFNYWGPEGQVLMEVWNEMLAVKKLNCETEKDCIIIDGIPKVIFENISTNDVPTQLKSKLGDYKIKLEKK